MKRCVFLKNQRKMALILRCPLAKNKLKKQKMTCYFLSRFFSKARKAAMTPLAPPPAPPTVPRLVEDVVPDDRDDPEIILSTTTVS